MTEKEKCAQGLLYDANYDAELLAERLRAKELLYDYNRLRPSQQAERRALLERLLGKMGQQTVIEQPFFCDYGYFMSDRAIGDNVFIAPNVGIYTAGHPLDVAQRNQGLEYARPVTIGNNVWIGAGVSILPGVTIGDGVVIGAGSVVTKDIPAGMLAVGNPCRVIREIAGK